jgi:hypothetical protein
MDLAGPLGPCAYDPGVQTDQSAMSAALVVDTARKVLNVEGKGEGSGGDVFEKQTEV